MAPRFFFGVARRDPTDKNKALNLAQAAQLTAVEHFVLIISRSTSKKRQQSFYTLLFQRVPLAGVVITGIADLEQHEEEGEVGGEPIPPDPADRSKDFALCYDACLKEIPDFLLTIASAVCGGCTATIVASLIPGAQPVSIPMLIVACSACAAAVGIILGNCLIQCHEMFGQ